MGGQVFDEKMVTEELTTGLTATELTLKDHVKGQAAFQYFRDNELWYKTEDTNYLFPIPVEDTVGAVFNPTEKAFHLMKWIRKYLEEQLKENTPQPGQ